MIWMIAGETFRSQQTYCNMGKVGIKISQLYLGGGFKYFTVNILYFHPYLGKIPILTNVFQMG